MIFEFEGFSFESSEIASVRALSNQDGMVVETHKGEIFAFRESPDAFDGGDLFFCHKCGRAEVAADGLALPPTLRMDGRGWFVCAPCCA